MAAAQPQNLEVFEAYFKRADLDQDGRISGSEAVAFFKGSNLQQPVLAQIWKYCDQNSSGFLSRLEFYNMLRLVTVAQSGRELTPDIVKAALFGPAAAKMPAPHINPVPGPATFVNSSATLRPQLGPTLPASAHMGVAMATGSQNSGIRAAQAAIPGFGANQQFVPSSNSNIASFPQGTPPAAYPSYPVQGFNQAVPVGTSLSGLLPASNTSNISTNSLGMDGVGSPGGTSQGPVQVIASPIKQDRMGLTAAGMTAGLTPKSFTPSALPTSLSNSVLDAKDSKPLVVTGNKLSSDSSFGGDVFSAIPPAKQEGISPALSSGRTLKPSGNQPQGTQSVIQQNSLDLNQRTSSPAAAQLSTGIPNSLSQPQLPWPRISRSDIQKYSKVFLEVDRDRDGKITGEQAYNLFLSWRLPREVLKQVWDLADQDNDSMLSLREFCIALYLMERYREGRPLPASLPDVLRSDETFIQSTGRPPISYGDPVWQPRPGLSQGGVAGPRPSVPVAGVRPPMQFMVPSEADRVMHLSQQRPGAPSRNLVVPQNKEQPLKEATDVHVKEAENKILDSKEKIEYYRTKMQELVLYKSRCDNRLNEITERASADKHEAEFLEKKYEEKYKQVAEVASKLTVEEAGFRDIQGRKLELQNAIVNMEKGGSSDGLLQVRADRIQSDLEELVKALHERCKHHGLHVKSKATIDLPFGWEPGIQEGATDWDEDWDKFEDEGFTFAKDLSVKLENDVASTKSRTTSAWSDKASTNGASPVASINHSYSIDEKLSSGGVRITESESTFTQDEYGSVRSPPGSPDRSAFGTSSQEFNSMHFDVNDISPRGKDNHSHGGDESTFSGDKFTDEPSWGAAFDTSDDVDSVWGFSTKDAGHERTGQNSFFGTEDFGVDPIRVDSPSASSVFGQDKKSPFFDSVPSTPHLKSSLSPRFSEGSEDHSFDNFSRFDSFGMHGNRFSPKRESLARFDSIASTSNFDHSRGVSFDDTDPFGTGPFKSLEIHSPRKNSDNWRSF